MEEFSNIIIFSDFAIFSSFSKDTTLDWLRNSTSFLTSYRGPFPTCLHERILIHVSNAESHVSRVSIQSSTSLDFTIDVLERVIDLLEYDEIDFFCPNESF